MEFFNYFNKYGLIYTIFSIKCTEFIYYSKFYRKSISKPVSETCHRKVITKMRSENDTKSYPNIYKIKLCDNIIYSLIS